MISLRPEGRRHLGSKMDLGRQNSVDPFTKNLAGPLFKNNARSCCGSDEHMKDALLEGS
jgi:hypothetical protein